MLLGVVICRDCVCLDCKQPDQLNHNEREMVTDRLEGNKTQRLYACRLCCNGSDKENNELVLCKNLDGNQNTFSL